MPRLPACRPQTTRACNRHPKGIVHKPNLYLTPTHTHTHTHTRTHARTHTRTRALAPVFRLAVALPLPTKRTGSCSNRSMGARRKSSFTLRWVGGWLSLGFVSPFFCLCVCICVAFFFRRVARIPFLFVVFFFICTTLKSKTPFTSLPMRAPLFAIRVELPATCSTRKRGCPTGSRSAPSTRCGPSR